MAKETPAVGTGGNPTITTGAYQTFIDGFLVAARQFMGGTAAGVLTIASGTVTPTEALVLKIDTEGAAASDNLDNMALTNVADGRLAVLRANDTARTVVVRHNQGGSGQFILKNGVNFTMDDTDKCIWFVLESSNWVELARFYGSDGAAFGAFIDLGSAAFADTGTSGSNVPTVNDILGKASFVVAAGGMGKDSSLPPGGPIFWQPGGSLKPGDYFLDFDDTVAEYAYFMVDMPQDYNGGTLEVKVIWGSESASTNTAAFQIHIMKLTNSSSMNASFGGTNGIVADANQAAADLNISSYVNVGNGGSSTSGQVVFAGRIKRTPGQNGDNLSGDARLKSLMFRYTRNALNDD